MWCVGTLQISTPYPAKYVSNVFCVRDMRVCYACVIACVRACVMCVRDVRACAHACVPYMT